MASSLRVGSLVSPHGAFPSLTGPSPWSGELQQEDDLLLLLSRGDSEGEPLQICRDPVKNSLWMVTTSSIYQVSLLLPLLFFAETVLQITTTNEDRTVWSMYLAKAVRTGDGRLFDTAHQFCKSEVALTLSFSKSRLCLQDDRKCVHQAQAVYYLNKGIMDKAATHFAVTSLPFDEVSHSLSVALIDPSSISQVVIMLLSAIQNPANLTQQMKQSKKSSSQRPPPSSSLSPNGQFHIQPDVDISELDLYLVDEGTIVALRIYLQEKLRMLHVSAKSQRTMIATWLCEIYIHMLAVYDQLSISSSSKSAAADSKLLKMFKDFLRNNRWVSPLLVLAPHVSLPYSGTLDTPTTISLLVSRGPEFRPILLFYCQIVGDYDRVLSQYISEGKYSDAIAVLQNSPIEKVEGLIYKKAPVLMEHHPEMAVELFLSKKYLRITHLLPALYRSCCPLPLSLTHSHSLLQLF
jgi:hypothetical protein